MLKKIKSFSLHVLEELLGVGVGWIVGLITVQVMTTFFEKSSWTNLWGVWSDKFVVEESTFSIMEWVLSALVGYLIMKGVNKFWQPIVHNWFHEEVEGV